MEKSRQALCASAIRKELKEAFPLVKFSIRSESFSMGDSVNISWTDGPSRDKVEEITGKYQYGHFDGSIDLYEYSNSRKDIPQSKYVMTNREISNDLTLGCAQTIAKDYDLKFPENVEDLGKSFDWDGEYWNFHQIVWKYCNRLDFTVKRTIKHIENYCGTRFDCYEVM